MFVRYGFGHFIRKWIAHSARFVAIALCLNRLTSPQHPQNKLVFTASPDAQFESFNLDDMQYNDAKLSIYFETKEIMEESLILLRFNCPDSDCVFIAKGWDDLKTHARTVHGKVMWLVSMMHRLSSSLAENT